MRELQDKVLLVLPDVVHELGEAHVATLVLVGLLEEFLKHGILLVRSPEEYNFAEARAQRDIGWQNRPKIIKNKSICRMQWASPTETIKISTLVGTLTLCRSANPFLIAFFPM